MSENRRIIEKAEELGLDTGGSGSSENEQMTRIAEQLGISNYNWMSDRYDLVNKINNMYNDAINNSASSIPRNNSLNKNHMSSFSSRRNISNSNNSLKEKLNKNRAIYNQIQQIAQQNNQQEGLSQNNEDNLKNTSNKLGKLLPSSLMGNKLGKKKSQKNTSSELAGTVVGSIMLPAKPIIYGMIGVIALVIILVVCIVGFSSQDEDSELNSQPEVVGYIKGTSTSKELTSKLVYMNLCTSHDNADIEEQECLNSPAGKYFTHLKNLYKNFQTVKDMNGNPVLLDVLLMLETVSYSRTDAELFDENNTTTIINELNELANAMVENYQEVGDVYRKKIKIARDENGIAIFENGKLVYETTCILEEENKVISNSDGAEIYYRISYDKYVSYLKYGGVHENYSNKPKIYDADIHPEEDCIPDGRSYQPSSANSNSNNNTATSYSGNVTNGFIFRLLNNGMIDENELKTDLEGGYADEVVSEIFNRANQNYDSNIINPSIVCSGIMVTGDSAGVYSLDEYIAGVVQAENPWYQGDNIENMKAQAVAARTYALRRTNNCSLPIQNSASVQAFNPNPSSHALRAATETSNQVLVDNSGNYISTEYDAFAVKEITGSHYILKQANLQIPISWVNENISRANLEYYENHSHGRGMSQWGSRYLQTKGYKYDQILQTFYTNGELITMGNSMTVDIPKDVNDLRNRYYFNFDISSYRNGTNFGQCVWYAKHRAMEIIATSSLNESTKQLNIQSIKATPGNGVDWFANPDSRYFSKSANINDARAGAIVSWKWTNEKCIKFHGQPCDAAHPNYGHVAIIESVYTAANGKTMVTLTEGWRAGSSGGKWSVTNDLWSVVRFKRSELTLEQLRVYSGHFNGYVYLY